jgi:SAM-dependent methyltransferase
MTGESYLDAAKSIGAKSSNKGERGITKRLEALARLTDVAGDRLLDVGCADGTYTRRLAENFQHVDAIDVEPERLHDFRDAIAGTPEAARITIHRASADDLPFDDNTFDVATAIEVLEHVGDLDASLAQIRRVLKPAGKLLLTSPNRWFPIETHGFLLRGRRYSGSRAPGLPWVRPLHSRLSDARAFTVRGLGAQVTGHGFELLGFDYIMPPFDQSPVGQRIRPFTDAVERSPLRFFGMALVMAFRKR